MRFSKSMLSKLLLAAGFILCSELGFATDTVPVPIPPDKTPPEPPTQIDQMTTDPSATATINDVELAVYFEYSVGDATITVYDADNNIVYQTTVDTDSTTEVYIPVSTWDSGEYTLTVTYGTTTQRGSFQI